MEKKEAEKEGMRRSLYMRLFLHPLLTAANTHTHKHTCRLSGTFGHARITTKGRDGGSDSDVDDF